MQRKAKTPPQKIHLTREGLSWIAIRREPQGQLCKWLRRLPIDADVQVNLLASELTVAA
jgi:hypothetical protein